MSATNIRPSERLREIIQLISWIPLRSYKIMNGDLDTRYSVPEFSNRDFTSARLAMNMLIDNPNELLNLDYFAKSMLEHFMGTVKHYENDKDVRLLLTNPTLKQLALESGRIN